MPPKHTAQSFYDLLVRTSAEGRFPSTTVLTDWVPAGTRVCAYRSDDGRACPVGLLIPDDRYVPTMENVACADLVRRWDLWDCIPDGMEVADLESIQDLHDGYETDAEWDHRHFVSCLNQMGCFATCNTVGVSYDEAGAP